MADNKVYNIDEIKKVLPHTYPFLLVDRVVEMQVGKSVKAYKNLSINEPFFQGHFPSKPVMPGALIIEALAQSGAFALLSEPTNKGKIVFLTGADNFKFRGIAIPGDRLDMQVDIEGRRGSFGTAKASASIAGVTVASGELKFFIGE